MTQKYTPTKWVANETIGTANVMNNIEQGIVGAYDEIDKVNSKVDLISINVVDFGAKGDGITDDTEAIQNALNYSNEYKIPTVFKKGVYKLNSNIILQPYTNIVGNDAWIKIDDDYIGFKRTIDYNYSDHNFKKGILRFNNVNFELKTTSKSVFLRNNNMGEGSFVCFRGVDIVEMTNCKIHINDGGFKNDNSALTLKDYILNGKFSNCSFVTNSKTNWGCPLISRTDDVDATQNIIFENCVFESNSHDENISIFGKGNNNVTIKSSFIIKSNEYLDSTMAINIENGATSDTKGSYKKVAIMDSNIDVITDDSNAFNVGTVIRINQGQSDIDFLFSNNKVNFEKNTNFFSYEFYPKQIFSYDTLKTYIERSFVKFEKNLINAPKCVNLFVLNGCNLYVEGNKFICEKACILKEYNQAMNGYIPSKVKVFNNVADVSHIVKVSDGGVQAIIHSNMLNYTTKESIVSQLNPYAFDDTPDEITVNLIYYNNIENMFF